MIRDSLHVLGVGRYTTKDTNTSLFKMLVQKDRNGVSWKRTVFSTCWETRSTTWSCLCKAVCTCMHSPKVSVWVGLYGVTHMLAHIIINWCLNVCAFRVTYVCWCVVTELIRKAVLFELVWSLEVQELFPREIEKKSYNNFATCYFVYIYTTCILI